MTNMFPPAAESRQTDDTGIMDLPPFPVMSYDQYNAADGSNNPSDLGIAEDKPPISLK